MLKFPKTCLGVYASLVSVALAALVLMGAKSADTATFKTLDVQRINVREPDGTLRMVISDKAAFPGLIIHGKEHPHHRPRAGMLFYNDEATEQGGLIFSGRKNAAGNVSSGLSLTFDRYDQGQQLQLIGLDRNGRTYAGLQINDVPEHLILQDLAAQKKLSASMSDAARKALVAKLRRAGHINNITPRYFAGKTNSNNSVVMLNDVQGKPRLLLMVTKQGKASIQFLDASGRVQRKLTADDLATK